MTNFPFFVPDKRAFRKNIRTPGTALQGLGHDFFGVPQAIDGGGVYPIHSGIKGGVDGSNGVVVILWAPGKLPPSASHSPCPNANGRNLPRTPAEFLQL